MKQSLIKEIQQEMAGVLNNAQRQKLDEVLEHCFFYVEVVSLDQKSLPQTKDNSTLKDEFLSAKQVEGCSLRSIKIRRTEVTGKNSNIVQSINAPIFRVAKIG